jgi:hypothetical protein
MDDAAKNSNFKRLHLGRKMLSNGIAANAMAEQTLHK